MCKCFVNYFLNGIEITWSSDLFKFCCLKNSYLEYSMGKDNPRAKITKKVSSKKTSYIKPEEKTAKSNKSNKSSLIIKAENKELNDVDSLEFLKDSKPRKTTTEIDERIRLLKTELKILLGDVKTDKASDIFVGKSNEATCTDFDIKKLELDEKVKPVEIQNHSEKSWVNKTKDLQNFQSGSTNFTPNFNSTPLKFSEWLDKTIDVMDSQFISEKSGLNESELNLELKKNSTSEKFSPSTIAINSKSSSNIYLLTSQKTEELLYKSFLMQNSIASFHNLELSSFEQNRSTKNKELSKSRKFRKPYTKHNRSRLILENSKFNALERYSRKENKRANKNIPHCDVEVINLDSSSEYNKTLLTNTVYGDLDINNYDWNEPFETFDDPNPHSEVQEIESSERENCGVKNSELNMTSYTIKQKECVENFSFDGDQRSTWECPVCFERSKGQEIVATQCGHVFCKRCLENHISKVCNNCPSCRCDMKEKPFITLFNF